MRCDFDHIRDGHSVVIALFTEGTCDCNCPKCCAHTSFVEEYVTIQPRQSGGNTDCDNYDYKCLNCGSWSWSW